MNNLLRTLIIFAAIALSFSACNISDSECSIFTPVDKKGWAYGDTVKIMVTDLDSVCPRAITIGLRHNDDYLYRNLWLEVSYLDTAKLTHRDTLNINMADQYGRWCGQGLGGNYQLQIKLPHQVNIPDSATISLRHIMRVDTLRGIDQIGIRIDRYNKPTEAD